MDALQNTFEGLTIIGEDDKIHPNLAESWEISPNGRTYTFHLKHGVKFHTGREMHAEDVKRSLERACNPALASPMAGVFLNDIDGMAAVASGKTLELSGVHAKDPYTLEITLNAPRPYFLAKLSCLVSAVVDVPSLADGVHVRKVSEAVGTGPFRIESCSDQELVQVAFDSYHRGKPGVERIVRQVMADTVTRLQAYQRGEIDLDSGIPRSEFVELAKSGKPDAEAKLMPHAAIVYLGLDAKRIPDPAVRQAIALCIDKDEICREAMLGTVRKATGILPPGVPGYRADAHTSFSIERARQLVRGKKLPELHISVTMTRADFVRVAEAVGSQLTEALGMTVRIDTMDNAAFVERDRLGDFQAVLYGWYADYMDPQDFLSALLLSDSSQNRLHYSSREFDQVCLSADSCLDEAKRLALYQKAEDIAMRDCVIVPICFGATPVLVSPRVKGLRWYSGQFLPYNSVTVN